MTRIAIIADPHFHDIGFDPAATGVPYPALRTLSDSIASTRIFNESGAALSAALDAILARGIRLVVIAGDLTDDGQRFNWRAVTALLDRYRARGLRFYATPGNHDLFAMAGRHHSKRFLLPDGSSQLVSSDPASGADLIAPDMFCPGYPEVLPLMRDLGYAPGRDDLHWETPFGTDPHWSSRLYDAVSPDGGTVLPMVDASYLVEPVPGLWLLSLDANIFRPNDAAAIAAGAPAVRDCTEMGWNAALTDKPHLLVWASDVARRAREQGKRLLAFSHYPVVDPLNGSGPIEQRLLGDTGFVRRMPSSEVAAAFAATGVGIHFSGHWHVNNTARHVDAGGHIVNIAVPSLVAFPPALKLVDLQDGQLTVETLPVPLAPGFDAPHVGYAAEARRDGLDATAFLDAPDYAAFLDAHLAALAERRDLAREWPEDLARLVPLLPLAQLHRLAQSEPIACTAVVPETLGDGQPRLLDLVVNWYGLRKGGDLALGNLASSRRAEYRSLIKLYAGRAWPDDSLQGKLAALLAILQLYLQREPSADFTVALPTGSIAPLSAAAPISARPAAAGR